MEHEDQATKKQPILKLMCGHCMHFSNAPAVIEATFKGLSAMSSGNASVRGHDGLCDLHGVYLPFQDCCADFSEAKAHATDTVK